MIKQTKALADRRREKRFQVRSGALVKYNRHATKLGQTLDISVGGLAFNYVARRKLPQGSCVIEILFADYGFFLNDIGFETIWDIKTRALPASSMAMRQSGVKFIGLSRHQEVQLAAIFRIDKKRSAERKRAKEAAELAYAELNQIFETAAGAIRVIDKDFNMLRCNQTFWNLTGAREAEGRKCYDVFPGSLCHTSQCPLSRIIQGEERVECQIDKVRPDGGKVPCILTATPFRQTGGELIGIVEDFKDVSHIKQVVEEHERTIAELQRAVAEVKVLSGLLPVCASCKKIRDDNGYWNQIEAYVRKHSEADFTHSICPDCAEELYPDFVTKGKGAIPLN
jgi:PAS domain S-box-containing protein